VTGPDRAARGDVGRGPSDEAQTSSRSFSQVRLVAERWVGSCGIAGLGEPSERVRRRIELSELAENVACRPKASAIPPAPRMDAVPVRPPVLWLRRESIRRHRARDRTVDRQRFVGLREEGWSILAAAREVRLSRTTRKNWLRGYICRVCL
jgi:hypothetical protein